MTRRGSAAGSALKSPFGTFYAPNISPDPKDGIGKWSEADFVTAMVKGTSPDGEHYFPAFPYTSYQRMKLDDVRDLFAYLKTLPAVQAQSKRDTTCRFRSISAARSAAGSSCSSTASRSSRIPPRSRAMESRRLSGQRAGPLRRMPFAAQSARRHHRKPALRRRPDPDGEGWVPNITQQALGD